MRFGKFFRGESGRPAPDDEGDELDTPVLNAQPITGPPDFVRAAKIHRDYWTLDADALAQLEARGVEQLGWRELLRLHHLICLQRLTPGLNGRAPVRNADRRFGGFSPPIAHIGQERR